MRFVSRLYSANTDILVCLTVLPQAVCRVNASYEIRVALLFKLSFVLSLSISFSFSLYLAALPFRDSDGRVVKNFPTQLCDYGNR